MAGNSESERGQFCASLMFTKDLFLDTYRRDATCKEELQEVKRQLYTKTLICHAVLTLTRSVLCCLGLACWQKAFDERKQLTTKIDQNFVNKTEDTIKLTLYCLIMLSLALDITVFFKRKCARLIIYMEAVFLIVLSFVPYDQGTFTAEINLL